MLKSGITVGTIMVMVTLLVPRLSEVLSASA